MSIQILAHKQTNSSSTATLVQYGVVPNCLLSSTHDPWVINSGASDHITGSSTTLSNCHLANSSQSVTNVSLAKVAGLGNTHFSVDLKLLCVICSWYSC